MSSTLRRFDDFDGKKLLEELKVMANDSVVIDAVFQLIRLDVKTSYFDSHGEFPTERYIDDIIIKTQLHRMSGIIMHIQELKIKDLQKDIIKRDQEKSQAETLFNIKQQIEELEK